MKQTQLLGRCVAAAALFATGLSVAHAQVPAGYPANYQATIDGAKKEGKLIVYSVTDTALVRPLIKDFEALYGVKVEYNDMNSTELYNRYISEYAANSTSADVLWSSAMDLQVKLVNDGTMASYESPESSHIPQWAQYQKQAYGTTYEPLAIVYNKRLLPADQVPQTRVELIKLLQSDPAKFKGKVTTYDIEKSGVGFNYLTQDARVNPEVTWELVGAMGALNPKLQSSTGAMMERISSGENLIGYNILGSYAFAKAKRPVDRLRLPARLHAGGEPSGHHLEEGQERQRRQAVGRLPALEARPDAARESSQPVLDPRRRGRRDLDGQPHAAIGRCAQADSDRCGPARLSRPIQAPRIPEALATVDQALISLAQPVLLRRRST